MDINQSPLLEYNGPRRRDEEQPLLDRSVRQLDKNDISRNVAAIIVGNMHRENQIFGSGRQDHSQYSMCYHLRRPLLMTISDSNIPLGSLLSYSFQQQENDFCLIMSRCFGSRSKDFWWLLSYYLVNSIGKDINLSFVAFISNSITWSSAIGGKLLTNH